MNRSEIKQPFNALVLTQEKIIFVSYDPEDIKKYPSGENRIWFTSAYLGLTDLFEKFELKPINAINEHN